METLTLKQVREKLAVISKQAHDAYEQAGAELDFTRVKCLGEGDTKAKLEKLEQINRELNELHTEFERLTTVEKGSGRASDLDKMFNSPASAARLPGAPERKSVGQLIMAHPGLFARDGAGRAVAHKNMPVELDIDLKADFFRGDATGWAPENIRLPRVELYPVRQLRVADFLPTIPTAQAAVKYMEETTYTPTLAAEAAEGAAAGEVALALTERTVPVEKVACFLPTSEEQLEDVPAAEAYLNMRLGYMVMARLDSQILNGNGTPPNLKGTLNIGVNLQTQPKGTDPTPDAIYKLFTKIRTVGFAEPSVLLINPTDWQDIRLLRTADGIYVFGNPNEAGMERIWGVPVAQTTAVVANIAIAGDYINFAALYLRRGLQIEMSSGYSDYFVKGKFAVKATMRCAVVHFRTAAFGTITGI